MTLFKLKVSPSFLARINPRKTKLRLYAMSSDYDRNLNYARMMLATLEKANIPPEQTELMLLGTDEMKGMIFQSGKNQYGYGNVVCFDEFEIASRLLIHKYPLCNTIKKRMDEIKEHGSSSVKMTKDMKKRTHVCFVSWDELDEISEMENSLTHDNADYKENDRRNVELIAGLAGKMLPANSSA